MFNNLLLSARQKKKTKIAELYSVKINRSLVAGPKIRGGSNASVTRTFTSSGISSKKGTLAFWLKYPIVDDKDNEDTYFIRSIYVGSGSGDPTKWTYIGISHGATGGIFFRFSQLFGSTYELKHNITLAGGRSEWFHVVCMWDTTSGTSSQRMRMFINGVEIYDTSRSNPSLDYSTRFSLTDSFVTIGYSEGSPGVYNIADVYFIDGQNILPTEFIQWDSTDGILKPKRYTVPIAGNSFYLNFEGTTTTEIAQDKSGNGQHFSPSNVTIGSAFSTQLSIDSPSNRFPVFVESISGNEWSDNDNISLGGRALRVPADTNSRAYVTSLPIPIERGTWYFEMKVIAGGSQLAVGLGDFTPTLGAAQNYHTDGNYVTQGQHWLYSSDAFKIGPGGTSTSYGATWTAGDVIGCVVDKTSATSVTITFTKNGVSQGTAFTLSGSDIPHPEILGLYVVLTAKTTRSGTSDVEFNFGQMGSFAYASPDSSALPFCTENFDVPEFPSLKFYNDVVRLAGNGTMPRTVRTWYSVPQARANPWALLTMDLSADHFKWWWDSIYNGAQGWLLGGTTFATQSGVLGSPSGGATDTRVYDFQSNGVRLGNQADTNASGDLYLHFFLEMNPDIGFKRVTYTGNGSGTARAISHTLGMVPYCILVRRLDGSGRTTHWFSYPKGSSESYEFTAPGGSYNTRNMWGSLPTATDFYVRDNGAAESINVNGGSYVAYIFAPNKRAMAVGSYIGQTKPIYCHCGFKPLIVFILNKSTGKQYVYSPGRITEGFHLQSNLSVPEAFTGVSPSFEIAGFKVHGNDSTQINTASQDHLWFAIAGDHSSLAVGYVDQPSVGSSR